MPEVLTPQSPEEEAEALSRDERYKDPADLDVYDLFESYLQAEIDGDEDYLDHHYEILAEKLDDPDDVGRLDIADLWADAEFGSERNGGAGVSSTVGLLKGAIDKRIALYDEDSDEARAKEFHRIEQEKGDYLAMLRAKQSSGSKNTDEQTTTTMPAADKAEPKQPNLSESEKYERSLIAAMLKVRALEAEAAKNDPPAPELDYDKLDDLLDRLFPATAKKDKAKSATQEDSDEDSVTHKLPAVEQRGVQNKHDDNKNTPAVAAADNYDEWAEPTGEPHTDILPPEASGDDSAEHSEQPLAKRRRGIRRIAGDLMLRGLERFMPPEVRESSPSQTEKAEEFTEETGRVDAATQAGSTGVEPYAKKAEEESMSYPADSRFTPELIEALKGTGHLAGDIVDITGYMGSSTTPEGVKHYIEYKDSEGNTKFTTLDQFIWMSLPPERRKELEQVGINPYNLDAGTDTILEPGA